MPSKATRERLEEERREVERRKVRFRLYEEWFRGHYVGWREGCRRGVREGEVRGLTTALTLVLERRFRAVPARFRKRIASAGPVNLKKWLDRAMEAATVDAVFAPAAKH